jgi:hypothetical protein
MSLRTCLTAFAVFAFAFAVRVAVASAEAGSSIHRLPSGDAAGPSRPLPTWLGIALFSAPVVLLLLRALVLNLRGR